MEFKSPTDSPLTELEQGTSTGKLGDYPVVPNSVGLQGEGMVRLLWCSVEIEANCRLLFAMLLYFV